MRLAALYSPSGRVVTGFNHGDAFGKLTADEQDGDLTSGFLDPDTGLFTSDTGDFFVKHIIMLRHGACSEGDDPPISTLGREQVSRAAECLARTDLSGYQCFASPSRRCQQSAEILSDKTKLPFLIHDDLRDQHEDDAAFCVRVGCVFSCLPVRSLLVTHCDVIFRLASLTTGRCGPNVPNGSLTLVCGGRLVCFGCPQLSDGVLDALH